MKVTIAIPAYTGIVHLGTMQCLLRDLIRLIQRGDTFDLVADVGNACIADCRGVIATNFLHSDSDVLVFVDSDVAWQEGGLLTLIDHPVDCVAGIYPMRVDPLKWSVHYLDRPELWADPQTGLLEVAAVPAGFWKLSKQCVQKMAESYPQTYAHAQAHNQRFYPWFESVIDEAKGWKLGEDISFCWRWREIGGNVWCDPEIEMGHIGNKIFQASYGDWLRNRS